MPPAAIGSRAEAMQGDGSAEQAGGEDPTGQSGGTMSQQHDSVGGLMFAVLVYSALLAPPPDTSGIRADLVMAAAVEEFVAELPSARPPEPFRTMLEDLGQDCYGCRVRADRRLTEGSRADVRWLFWGRHRETRRSSSDRTASYGT